MTPWMRGCSLALLAALTAGVAHAQTLIEDLNSFATDTGQYNLITFGNATLSGSSDTQGGIAIGGSLTIGGSWTIASQTGAGSNPSFYVNGSTLSLSGNTQLNNGYASAPNVSSHTWKWDSTRNEFYTGKESNGNDLNTTNASGTYAHSNPITNPAPSGWNWTTQNSDFTTISTNLNNATANGAISVSGQNLVFTPPVGMTNGVAVFSMDASLWSGNSYNGQTVSNIQINVPSGIDYVINVVNVSSGQTLFGSGVNFNSGSNDNQLLWNFEGSSNTFTLSDGGNFYGSVLAPTATITDGTTIDGQVVANAFSDSGVELHDSTFTPVSVLVPEAGTFTWWALGLCGAAVLFRRRPRRLRA